MTTEVKDILSTKGPTTEIINVMPSDDLYSVVAYMVRPNTLTNALQVLRSVKVVGAWQNTDMPGRPAVSLSAVPPYLYLCFWRPHCVFAQEAVITDVSGLSEPQSTLVLEF